MLEIGSVVDGKYKILRIVGKGGMSVVYQAVNEKANKIWAIKEVRKDGVQNFEVVKQNLIVETELLKRFNHPNLPSIIDVIDSEGSFLIVMDYIEGNSLSKALETGGAQSQDDVIEWSKQLCDVLGYLHSRKPPIIYRDMKPANVMLKPDGNISLIDFGTAREFKSASVEDTTCLGTQGYAAPEQYGGHGQTDARTDIYCLGATMYHLVTGHNPSKPPYEMYPIRHWNPTLSSGLEEIIIKCTQRNPDDRYQSCSELLYALEHYQDLDIENKKAQNRKWKIFLTTVILMLVMALAAVGFKIAANSETSAEYEAFMKEAQTASLDIMNADPKEAQEAYDTANTAYQNAIKNNPGKIDAYQGMLEMYLSDNELTGAEYSEFKNQITGNEDKIIASDKDGYADLCKELGDGVLFMLAKNANIRQGAEEEWYKRAQQNHSDPAQQDEDAFWVSFSQVCRDPFKTTPMGDPAMTYREYYDLVKNIIKSDHFASRNEYQKLRCFDYILAQLSKYDMAMIGTTDDKVTFDEFYNLVDEIQASVEGLMNDGASKERITNDNKTNNLYQNNIKNIEKIQKEKKSIKEAKGGSGTSDSAQSSQSQQATEG